MNELLVNKNYYNVYPSKASSTLIYENNWVSALPSGYNADKGIPLFSDTRISWLLEKMDVSNFKILELGPLEAGHTYMLEKIGKANVTAIESNANSFVKCLIVKNIFDMSAKFLLGDFVMYLEKSEEKFDLCMASGVLYHMTDPIGVLNNISRLSDNVFIWTHYYNPDRKDIEKQFGDVEEVNFHELNVRLVKHFYGKTNYTTFCGGIYQYSYWMYKQDLLNILNSLGFKDISIFQDVATEHPNGSCMCLLARK